MPYNRIFEGLISSMQLFKSVKTLVLLLIFGYFGKLVIGRVVFFHASYGDVMEVRKSYLKQIDACKSDETYHIFTAICTEAKREVNKSPVVQAFSKTISHTHSCIEYPCSDILKDIMGSWVATITFSALIFFGVTILLIFVYNRTKAFPITYYPNSKKDEIVYELSPSDPLLIKRD